jgi:hypothetical protein
MSGEADRMRRLNRYLVEAINETLSFGEVVLHFLELTTPLKREEIAHKPELFASELKKIFGDSSSIILEAIIRNLYIRLNIEYEERKEYTFQEYIREAARLISCQKSN